jgi:hypothetical protein
MVQSPAVVVVRNIRALVVLRPVKVVLHVMASVLSVESGPKNVPKHPVSGQIRGNLVPSKKASVLSVVIGAVIVRHLQRSKVNRVMRNPVEPMRSLHVPVRSRSKRKQSAMGLHRRHVNQQSGRLQLANPPLDSVRVVR